MSYLRYLQAWLILMVCAFPAHAWKINAELYSEAELSDNINSSSFNRKSEAIQTVGLVASVNENQKSMQANANFRLEKEHYFDDAYSDNTSLTTGFGLINIGFVEKFLDWGSSFSRTELLNDPLADDNPDSRGFRSILRTGPSINYNFSPLTDFYLKANYINVENSNEDISDSQRVDARLGFVHKYNRMTDFNINVEVEDVIDGDEDEEYTNTKATLGLVRHFNRGDFSVTWGRSEISPEFSKGTKANFLEFQMTRDQLLSHNVSFSYLQDVSDTSIGFESDEFVSEENFVLRGASDQDIVERRRFTGSVMRSVGAFRYHLKGFWEREDYDVQLNDERSKGISARLDRQLTKATSLGVSYQYEHNNYIERPSIGKEGVHQYGVDVRSQLSRSIYLASKLQFTTRKNESNMLRAYEELSANISFNWILR